MQSKKWRDLIDEMDVKFVNDPEKCHIPDKL
jgi:hypothetical protein